MLASVLPGIRHIRAPLAAGVLWLMGAWTLAADHVPSRTEADGGLATLLDLAEELTPVERGAVAAFAAYLVGAVAADVVVPRAMALVTYVRSFRGPVSLSPYALTAEAELSIRTVARAQAGDVLRRLGRVGLRPSVVINEIYEFEDENDYDEFYAVNDSSELYDFVYRRTEEMSLAEFELLATRLIATEPALFSEVDRHRAEAELRFQLAPAIVFVGGALALTWNWLALLLVPVAGVLYWQGWRAAKAASNRVADAVLVGSVTPPVIERISRIADEAIAAKQAAGVSKTD